MKDSLHFDAKNKVLKNTTISEFLALVVTHFSWLAVKFGHFCFLVCMIFYSWSRYVMLFLSIYALNFIYF